MIKGQLQEAQVNSYGYTRIKVSGTWYGGDKKAILDIPEGSMVEFEAFKNAKGYDTFKVQSFKQIAETAPASTSSGNGSPKFVGAAAGRDTYWSDKAKSDAEKDPRIAYQGAAKIAIQFVDLAIRAGALKAIEKAKETAKLEVLTALVDEQTLRIMAASYAAVVPSLTKVANDTHPSEDGEIAAEDGAQWK